MANTIKFDYQVQARYLQMIAEDLGLVLKNPVKENGLAKEPIKAIKKISEALKINEIIKK